MFEVLFHFLQYSMGIGKEILSTLWGDMIGQGGVGIIPVPVLFSQDFIYWYYDFAWPREEEEEDFWFDFPISIFVFSEPVLRWRRKNDFDMKN